jgi:hypothetical protein
MGEGTLLRRAWIAMHVNGRLRKMDPATRHFWLEVVMAIREEGDGRSLRFAECGYDDAADFATAFEGGPEALALLVRRRVLEDLEDGAGIALPLGLGLTPREKLGGTSIPGQRTATSGDQRQPAMIFALRGGLAESEETRIYSDSESEETRIYSDSDSGKTRIYSDSPAAGTTTTTKARSLESLAFSSSSPLKPGARESEQIPHPESEEIRISSDSESEENTPMAPGARARDLARQIGAACGYGEPTAADVAKVGEWLAYPGLSDSLVLAAIAEDRQGPNPLPVRSLALFTRTIKAALSVERAKGARTAAAPPAAPAVPRAPPSEAERAAADAWRKLERRGHALMNWFVGHRIGATPPLPQTIAAHYKAGARVAADRWLAVMEAARDAGEPCLLLPQFDPYMADPAAFEEQMLKCEEALTVPERPADG